MTNAIDLPKTRTATEQEGGRRVETDHDGVLVYAKRVVALSGGPFLKRSRTRQIDRTLTRHFCARNARLVLEVARKNRAGKRRASMRTRANKVVASREVASQGTRAPRSRSQKSVVASRGRVLRNNHLLFSGKYVGKFLGGTKMRDLRLRRAK